MAVSAKNELSLKNQEKTEMSSMKSGKPPLSNMASSKLGSKQATNREAGKNVHTAIVSARFDKQLQSGLSNQMD